MNFNKYIGLPFKSKGRSLDGCDCWGLVYLILKHEFNVQVPTYTDDYMSALEKKELHDLINRERTAYVSVPLGQERPGDIVALRIEGKSIHVGIVSRKGRLLHIMENIRSVEEKLYGLIWKHRIIQIGRHEQLTG